MSETIHPAEPDEAAPKTVRVWDPIVRIGHWVIVIGVLTAYFTGDEVPTAHLWAGYIVGGAVIIRVVWGFIGSPHARFSSFVTGPGAVWSYVTGLFNGKAKRTLGHNPAGAAMTLALLLALTGVTVSGVALQAVEDGTGPLAGIMATTTPSEAAAQPGVSEVYGEESEEYGERGERGEGGGEGAEELYEGLHSFFVYLTLALAFVHVIGVVASSLVHRENLPGAMLTGRKRP